MTYQCRFCKGPHVERAPAVRDVAPKSLPGEWTTDAQGVRWYSETFKVDYMLTYPQR